MVEHRKTDHEKRGDPNRKHFSLSGWFRRFDSGPCNLINVTLAAIIQFLMVKVNKGMTPLEAMQQVINSERYEAIRISA